MPKFVIERQYLVPMYQHLVVEAENLKERFTSLIDMQAFKHRVREQSHATVISSRKLAIEPTPDDVRRLMVVGDDAHDAAALTHWSFGQLCSLASPAIRRPATSATRTCLLP
jgi:hypothetical protein